MRLVLTPLVLMTLAFAPAPQPKAKPDTTAADLKRLQGTGERSGPHERHPARHLPA